jgi:hypothetical protein
MSNLSISELVFDRWGAPSVAEPDIQRVMFKRSEGGGFLMVTEEIGGVFDIWIETVDEVESECARLRIVWE